MKKFKLVTFLGIRPDYIRMEKLIKLLDAGQKKNNYKHILVHSGQHYDPELFGNFIKEFNIRKPDIDLGIGLSLKNGNKNNHASQLSLLSERVFDMIKKIKPDAILYLGDTNTVLSSVVVARSGVPIIHIEAGGRSFDWRMPEEKNRVIVDHLSDALYPYLDRYKDILLNEGIDDFRVKVIGNIVVDPIENYKIQINKSDILERLKVKEKGFILITLHREENTSDKKILENKLRSLLKFAKEKQMPIVFPLMPRVKNLVDKFKLNKILEDKQFIISKPLGFFDFIRCEQSARLIVSDSGTVQEEALILGTPCVIARRSTERPETVWAGATILEGIEGENTLYKKMKQAWSMKLNWDRNILNPNGGSPSERVFKDLVKKIKTGYFETSHNFQKIKDNKFAKESYCKTNV